MIKSRVLLHPLLSNNRSRAVLIIFFATIAATSGFMWWRVIEILKQAGTPLPLFHSMQTVPFLAVLVSPYIQVIVVLASVLLASTTTAVSIIGPVKRLEQWLMDWDMGFTLSPLQSRTGDAYENMIRLINDLYLIKKPVQQKKKIEKPIEAPADFLR